MIFYLENITLLPSKINPVWLWLVRVSSGDAHWSVIGQCITCQSLLFPVRQEINTTIFIIFFEISPNLYRYLVHIILNQCPCQVSRHSHHKQWRFGPVRSGRVKCELPNIWPRPYQHWTQLIFQNDKGWSQYRIALHFNDLSLALCEPSTRYN